MQFQTSNGILTCRAIDSGHEIRINHETNPTVLVTLPTRYTYEVSRDYTSLRENKNNKPVDSDFLLPLQEKNIS